MKVFSSKVERRLNEADWQNEARYYQSVDKKSGVDDRVPPSGGNDNNQNFLEDCCRSNCSSFSKSRNTSFV